VRQRWKTYRADAIEPRFFLLRQLPVAGWGLLVALTTLNTVLGLLPVGFVIATSVLIGRAPAAVAGGLGSPQWDALVSVFLVASGLFLAQQLLSPVQLSLADMVKHRVDGHVHGRLMEVALRSTGIGPLEDQETLDHLRQAAESLEHGFRTPGDAAAGALAYVARYTRLAGFVAVIAVVASWWAALAVLASTMIFRYGQRGGLRMYMRLWPKVSPQRRERDYFLGLGLGAASAKELRVFGLTGWITDRYRASALAALGPLWRERRRVNVHRFLWFTAVGLVISCAVLAAMLRAAAEGRLTLTEITLGMQATIAAILLGEFYHESDPATQFGMNAVRALENFDRSVHGYAERDVGAGATGDAAGLPAREIRFAGVSFSYDDRPVLDGLELTLRAGECVALVGLNGAGKTTLVKLLARLYEPTGGAVLVDGRDVRDFTVESWRRQIGVIFQDFNRYELSVADNIAFGAIERPADDGAVRRAAVRAGLGDAVDRLPRGTATMLARHHDGGAELSGGQWQRVAIARALYAVDAGARVLVLDEPTAALDVRAEAEFFREFAQLTRGLTTLLISHRFSSVRQADRIVVLEHGRVAEDGTHESLLAAGGRYAELFRLQAERFAAGLGAEDDENDALDGPGGTR
jgi:ATP-binding cassette subfamily B protein